METVGKKHMTSAMLYYLFNAANMHRWNDHFRTVDLTELDKQAHKAVIAWVLGKLEEDAGNTIDWNKIIEHMLFSFIHRIAITDLKPPVYYEIIKDGSNKAAIDQYAYREFVKLVPDMNPEFLERFKAYLGEDHGSRDSLSSADYPREDKIIRAAHYLATRYEFDLIRDVNKNAYGIEKTDSEIEEQVESFMNIGLAGMDRLKDRGDPLHKFINLVGQLRCQQRWARAPREPKTTVLGHCVFVADAVYLHDLDNSVKGSKIYNDYYSGLFHDLPEVLTKDVITPVKTSSDELPLVLTKIEGEMFRTKIVPLIESGWVEELGNMSLTPFEYVEGFTRDFDAIKACDQLSAWIEAFVSIQYGVSSKMLRDAKVQIGYKLTTEGKGNRIDAAELIRDFESMEI